LGLTANDNQLAKYALCYLIKLATISRSYLLFCCLFICKPTNIITWITDGEMDPKYY